MKQSEKPKPQPPDLKILLAPIDKTKNFRSTSPLTIAKSIQAKSGSEPAYIKQYNSGILITCKHIKQYRLLQEIQTIGNIHVKVVEKEKGIKGVIYGVPLEMTEAEMLNELKTQQVISATRMLKKTQLKENSVNDSPTKIQSNSTPERTPLKTVVLIFNRSSLPTQIQLCFQVFKVKQYVPPPTRCYKCQRFGHAATGCRFSVRCVRCGDPHTFEQCPQKETPKCINCGGTHSAAYGGCETAKAAIEIQKVKIEKNISYAQASKVVAENASTTDSKADTTQDTSQQTAYRDTPLNKTTEATSGNPNRFPTSDQTKDKRPLYSFSMSGQAGQPTKEAYPQPNNTDKTTQNQSKENISGPKEVQGKDKKAFSIENSDMIISLIMAIISVFSKDMNRAKEMYHINMIKAAAERLLQIKELEFLNDEDN